MGILTSAASVFFLCACGTGVALYVVHVQHSRLDDASYRALCDVDSTITCSKIITEDRDFLELLKSVCNYVGVAYNDAFNPHQPLFRISFFPLLCFLGCLPVMFSSFIATFLSSISSLVSAYLLYMQFYVHNHICLPCIAGYFIHMLLFLVLIVRWTNAVSGSHEADTTVKSKQSQQSGGKGKGGGSQKSSSKQVSNQSRKERQSSDEGSSSGDSKEQKTGVVATKEKNNSGGRSRKKKPQSK